MNTVGVPSGSGFRMRRRFSSSFKNNNKKVKILVLSRRLSYLT